ncbi:MAG: NADH:flavin oxidoreductase/NADH oxidase [Alphaproteobacteria bacterium]|nr:NADH:flavin oxidoreductase/NADH oxidase [Alphaproteobacteria bacterium]
MPELSDPLLFTPLTLRDVRLKNRIVISPMQQYAAGTDGAPVEHHFVHYGRLAMGGAGLVFTEALCIAPEARLTYSDLGVWHDDFIAPLARLADSMRNLGTVPGAQILHAGRKASVQRPWQGYMPLTDEDRDARDEAPWQTVGPSPLPANPGWPAPRALTEAEIADVVAAHGAAARRCREAGFEVLDIHAAHGYLIHTFLSPISNRRNDAYGGDLAGRMRLALEVAAAVRAEWPGERPLFCRLSCIDDEPGGWTLEDSVVLARELGRLGVDVIDCSSRGLGQRGTPVVAPREQGFQVPFAAHIRRETDLKTMTVGLIMEPEFAEAVLKDERADLIAIGREALFNPQWPLQASVALLGDSAYERFWQPRDAWWLEKRARSLAAAATTATDQR